MIDNARRAGAEPAGADRRPVGAIGAGLAFAVHRPTAAAWRDCRRSTGWAGASADLARAATALSGLRAAHGGGRRALGLVGLRRRPGRDPGVRRDVPDPVLSTFARSQCPRGGRGARSAAHSRRSGRPSAGTGSRWRPGSGSGWSAPGSSWAGSGGSGPRTVACWNLALRHHRRAGRARPGGRHRLARVRGRP